MNTIELWQRYYRRPQLIFLQEIEKVAVKIVQNFPRRIKKLGVKSYGRIRTYKIHNAPLSSPRYLDNDAVRVIVEFKIYPASYVHREFILPKPIRMGNVPTVAVTYQTKEFQLEPIGNNQVITISEYLFLQKNSAELSAYQAHLERICFEYFAENLEKQI